MPEGGTSEGFTFEAPIRVFGLWSSEVDGSVFAGVAIKEVS